MAKQTRRGFIKQTSVSMATIGVLASIPGLNAIPALATAADSVAPDVSATELSATTLAGPLVAHISDFASGEISLLVGTQEIIYRDPELVMRLLNAIK